MYLPGTGFFLLKTLIRQELYMDHRFADIVKIDELRELMVRFDNSPDLPFFIRDVDGDILTASGWTGFIHFHADHNNNGNNCFRRRTSMISPTGAKREIFEHRLDNGLISFEIPIIAEGSLFATAISGQFLLDDGDKVVPGKNADLHCGQGCDTGSDNIVPLFSKDELWKKIDIFCIFADMLICSGLQGVKLKNYESSFSAYEEELAANREELLSLEKMKSELISTFSHELKTPLSIIKGYNELLYDGCLGSLDQSQTNALETSLFNIEKLERMIDSLLYIGMEYSTGHYYNELPLNILEVIEAATMDVTRSLNAKNMNVQTNIPEKVSIIRGDSKKLFQALIHLLDNAIKFSPSGSTITISVTESDDRLILSVQDRGIGIVEERLSCIFDSFYQADGSLTRKYPGIGLGLSICQSIIEQHEGRLHVESKVNEGSTFHIDLPIKERFSGCMSS